jgi:ribonucleoside-diphosphate reductase alpha chain
MLLLSQVNNFNESRDFRKDQTFRKSGQCCRNLWGECVSMEIETAFRLDSGAFMRPEEGTMRVRHRDGTLEPVDVIKITKKVARCGAGLKFINPYLVGSKAISGIYDGVSTKELDTLLMQTAAMLISEEPEYSKLAARLLTDFIDKEVAGLEIHSFAQSIMFGHSVGLISDRVASFVAKNATTLNMSIMEERCDLFEYFGLRTVYDRYLLKDPTSRKIIESPQFFLMRVACGLSDSIEEVLEFYELISSFEYMPSTPTLFNSGTRHAQMSSCYLLDSPKDDLRSIYSKYSDVAMLSKYAGGIGLSFTRVRARGSLIRGTNGQSNGIVPFLKTLDSSIAAVNQGGKRKGAACVYLETWHADLLDFLALRENTGDHAQRTHNLNLANWIPDLFMKRVEADKVWSLFDPADVPEFTDLYGEEFERAYIAAEEKGIFKKQMPARDLFGIMMKTIAQTGNGWMTFKDACNLKSNQTGSPENVIHLSNLCTEILEVSSESEAAVCNLGSINLGRYISDGKFDFQKLSENVQIALKFLDRVVDINYYPIPQAEHSNRKWRPVGLGIMGLQNVFFELGISFTSQEAKELSARIQEEIYFNVLKASSDLAEKFGPHEAYQLTRIAKGELQFDLWNVTPSNPERWAKLRERIAKTGLRNSLMIAIAPTATIASITGAYECIEPQVSNLFKRETLSGEFLQVNSYLVKALRRRGIWNSSIREKIKLADGSVQGIGEIPADLREIYRTVWEISQKDLIDMAADRGAYIDQSQSLNLFMESPNIGRLSSMYAYAWKKGLKTTYYLRSRGATKINKTTVSNTTAAQAVACSLENPEACESCQ